MKAAEHDYPVSVYNVGYLYELDCKYELAAKWYRRAEALMCDTKGRHISVASTRIPLAHSFVTTTLTPSCASQ